MLEIRDISKQYKTGDFVQHALNHVSVTLRDSEFVAILGPSGSGKTTLLNIIGGLDTYDSGDVVINGISTTEYKDRDWDAYRNHTVGFVFQSYNLIPHQTVVSNVELALTIGGVAKKQRRAMALEALEKVGLKEHAYKKPNQLSGGQMQRVAIARALVNNPRIILADEPTGALDSETSVQIMDLLAQVAQDRLVVMVTHNPELAHEYASRIVTLHDGVIEGDSNPVESDTNLKRPRRRRIGRSGMSLLTSLALSFDNLRTKKARTLLTSFAGSIGIIGIALIMAVSQGVNTYIADIQQSTMAAYPITIDEKSFDLTSMMQASNTNQAGDEDTKSTHDTSKLWADDSSFTRASEMTGSINENNLTAFKKYLDNPQSEIHQYIGSNGVHYSYNVAFSVLSHDSDNTLVTANGVTFQQKSNSVASQMATAGRNRSQSSITNMQMSMLTGKQQRNLTPQSFSEIMPQDSEAETGKSLVAQAVLDNYKLLHGSWPSNAHDVVLVADKHGEISLSALYELGLLPASQYQDLITRIDNGETIKHQNISLNYDDVLAHSLTLVPASDQYVKQENGTYRFVGDDATQMQERMQDAGIELNIVGVVQPKSDADAELLTTPVGYTHALTNELINHAQQSQIVLDQQADTSRNVLTGLSFAPDGDEAKAQDMRTWAQSQSTTEKANLATSMIASAVAAGHMSEAQAQAAQSADETTLAFQLDQMLAGADTATLVAMYNQYVDAGSLKDNLASFGLVSRDAPSSIRIYSDSFSDKDGIAQAIRNYNAKVSKKDKIVYVDYVGALMSSVTTIINVISIVLIAFVSVSLVVSSIMIGIITYISVLERTKEIGILRAMGASKRNVAHVFNAETGIIGLCSGLLGIGITLALLVPGNMLLHHFMSTDDVNAFLNPTAAVVLILLSIFLTILGGLIPSGKASRQDPAVALRSE